MKEARPNICEFTDYRSFLAAYAQDRRRGQPRWSYGCWARRIGLRDTSSLTKILNGDREPGPQITDQMIAYFRFKEKEAIYFRDLIRLGKIRKDPRLSMMLLEKMSKQHPNTSHRLLDEKTFSTISNWFYLPLREMTRLPEFREDPDWVTGCLRFKVSAREVRQAITALLNLNLLRRDANGRLRVAEGRLTTTDDVASEAIKRYHEQMLENAKIAVRSITVQNRELQAESLVICAQNLAEAKQMIREFKEKFSRTFEEENGDSVYQFQIQFFPLTRRKTE